MNMTRKAVETLLALTEQAGQVIPKDDLLKIIWPDRVVEEANLTQNIAMVRRALAAERGSAAYIETFPGRGYRLVGPVVLEEQAEDNGPARRNAAAAAAAPNAPFQPAPPQAAENADEARLRFADLSFVSGDTGIATDYSIRVVLRMFGPWVAGLLLLGAVVLGAWFWLHPSGEVRPIFHVTPLTRLAGRETQPALSPDGTRVAFLWEQDDGQPPELRVQADSPATSFRIGLPQNHYSSPAWSPDGRALAYLRVGKTATDVLTIALRDDGTTGAERLVAQFTRPNYGYPYRLLDWSPDGQWLAVSHADTPDQPNGLYLVNLATGEKNRLTHPTQMVGGDLDPRFSPDGKQITFVRHIHRSHQELYRVPAVGGPAQPLTTDAKQVSSHAWTADGAIVFASDREGEFRLWKLRVSTAGESPQRTEIFGAFPIEVSVARAAARLAFSVQQQDRNLWRLDVTSKQWTRVVASSAQDASPQYAPDGGKLCFRSDRSGTEQLWISDADGGNPVQLTQGELYPSVGHWSPDGRFIAFNNARTGEIFIAEPGAEAGKRIRPTGLKGIHPIFAPDGQWIYAGSTERIFKFPAGGGPAVTVVSTGGFSLGLSQDGRRLFFKREPNDALLWQADTTSGEMTRALDGLLPACTSCWALTPAGIYYLGSNPRSFDAQAIYFHAFAARAGEADRLVVNYPEPLAPVGSGPFSLSPDYQHLLCVRMNPSNCDIMQVAPFR